VVLATALTVSQIVEIDNYLTAFLPTNALRTITTFTATAAQTTFSVTYTQGLIDVYYNGSCLAQSEYTATNGTSIVLATACQVNDIVVVYAYSYAVGAYSGIGGSGTINTIPKFTASSTIGNSAITDDGTTVTLVSRALSGVGATFSGNLGINTSTPDILGYGTKTFGILGVGSDFPNMQIGIPGTSAATTDVMGDINFYSRNGTGAVVSRSLIRSGLDGATNSNYFSFFTMNAGTLAERFKIASNGSISNSNAPASNYAFQILGNSGTGVSYGSVIQAGTNSSDVSLDVRNYSGTTLLRVRGDGNVGIGTSSPSTFLHVLGSNTSGRGQLCIQSNNASNAAKATWYYDTTQQGEIGTTGGDFYALAVNNFPFYAGGSERMRITSGGNVLIGTTTDNGFNFVGATDGKHSYLGNTMQISANDYGGTERQSAIGIAEWANQTNPVINLASIFPRISMSSRALGVLVQITTNSSSSDMCSALVLFARSSNGTWSAETLGNIQIGGLVLTGRSGSGTSITLNFSQANFGSATITIMNRA
jgi:hypothetical protein